MKLVTRIYRKISILSDHVIFFERIIRSCVNKKLWIVKHEVCLIIFLFQSRMKWGWWLRFSTKIWFLSAKYCWIDSVPLLIDKSVVRSWIHSLKWNFLASCQLRLMTQISLKISNFILPNTLNSFLYNWHWHIRKIYIMNHRNCFAVNDFSVYSNEVSDLDLNKIIKLHLTSQIINSCK